MNPFTAVVARRSTFILNLVFVFWSSSVGEPEASIQERSNLNDQTTKTGPAVGQKIPVFQAKDQNGRLQDFESIRGPKGAVILFHRSADW
jgi:hypothetical protein